jgi:ABC-type Fe3+ transport system substrate-binding protein
MSPKLSELAKKAASEGQVTYQAPGPAIPGLSSDTMLRDMEALTQKHFGVKVKIKIDISLSFPASSSKILSEIKSGAHPSYDLMYQTPAAGVSLYKEKAIEAFPWIELFPFIRRDDLEYDGLALINSNYFLMPAYNTRLVKLQEAPKTWEELLDPKWKGKMGLIILLEPWLLLAQPNAWGEEKTFDYLGKLMRQSPKIGRFPELTQWLISGETAIAGVTQRERTLASKQLGAPVDVASGVEPVLAQANILFVPKGARNSNAAALVAAAMLTKEGQELQLKYQTMTSMLRPGTPAAKFSQSRKVIKWDTEFVLKKGNELSKKFGAVMVEK